MSAQRQHSNARLAGPWRQLGLAAAILMCAGLGACTAAQPPTSAATAPAEDAVPLPSQDADLDAGTYLFNGYTIPFEFTVPDGWTYVYDRLLQEGRRRCGGGLRVVRPRDLRSRSERLPRWPGTHHARGR